MPLLIAPEGIEIAVIGYLSSKFILLLIAPEGIEIEFIDDQTTPDAGS